VFQAVRGPRRRIEPFLLDRRAVHDALAERAGVKPGQGCAHLFQLGGIGLGFRELLGSHLVGDTRVAEVVGGIKELLAAIGDGSANPPRQSRFKIEQAVLEMLNIHEMVPLLYNLAMKPNSRMTVFVLGSALALMTGCTAQQPPAASDTRAADEAAIRAADIAWSKVGEAKLVDQHVAYYTEDAVVLPANGPLTTGKDAIRKVIADLYAMPGMSVKWQPAKVEVARSGDLGYSQGTYEMTGMVDAQGKPVTDRGKYVEVWRKQADGSWRCAVDIFNSDLPVH
jgi:ketosteroid isomerase-like protein